MTPNDDDDNDDNDNHPPPLWIYNSWYLLTLDEL